MFYQQNNKAESTWQNDTSVLLQSNIGVKFFVYIYSHSCFFFSAGEIQVKYVLLIECQNFV